MRNHGWQLPFHPLQVVAVSVFLAMAFAFYVFFMPFVGNRILEFHVLVLYSPAVVAVFGLYIWCAATNPADPGVFRSKKYFSSSSCKMKSSALGASSGVVRGGNGGDTQLSAESISHAKTRKDEIVDANDSWKQQHYCCSLGWHFGRVIFCKFCRHKPNTDQCMHADDMLYCSLCEVKIFKYSKHCRVCDKCVDGFDHHCRWLNNCIGRKNYKGFVALMISGILMFTLQWIVGIWVVVHCFLDRRQFEDDIASKLGNSFSLVPFIIVVASCTVLAMAATFPLGQLVFFHLLLIKKGIGTYDYIVAMREQENQIGAIEGTQSPVTSPASSVATAISGASSVGALQRGAWCTPPQLFLDNEQAVLQPDNTSALRDLEFGNTKRAYADECTKKKPAVKINPWALARLTREDVLRAASQARSNSSILLPVAHHEGMVVTETDSSLDNSSRDVSTEIFLPTGSKTICRRMGNSFPPLKDQFLQLRSWPHANFSCESSEPGDCSGNDAANIKIKGENTVPTPLQLEARSAFHMSETFCGALSGSSPESSIASPNAQPSRELLVGTQDPRPNVSVVSVDGSLIQSCTSDGYEASGGESADDSDQAPDLQNAWSKLKLHPYHSNRNESKHPAEKGIIGVDTIHTSLISPLACGVNKLSKADGLRQESVAQHLNKVLQEHPHIFGK